jgi:hypothetical protein
MADTVADEKAALGMFRAFNACMISSHPCSAFGELLA